MNLKITPRILPFAVALALTALLAAAACTKHSSAQTVDLQIDLKVPYHFVAYGDTRFHDSKDTTAANPTARLELVRAISDVNPAFVCFTGDIVYNGFDENDWKVWDTETAFWREKRIAVYPALGNHEFHGDIRLALGNYFKRFPDLKGSRYYSVHAANALLLVLDSSQEEVIGPQGEWLIHELDHVPPDISFVFVMLHHPPYSSSSDNKMYGGGHSARPPEEALARVLEQRQLHASFRIVVFSGHVHNYERHEHSGVTYFVSGGGGAHAYPIQRMPGDLFQSKDVNYHYLFVEVGKQQAKITMNRIDLSSGNPVWSQPDSVTIPVPVPAAQSAAH